MDVYPDIVSLVDQRMASQSVILPDSYTVDTLPAASATYLNKYANVTDLFGGVTDLVKCFKSGSSYYWRAVSPFAAPMPVTGGTLQIQPLKTPMSIFMTGTLVANLTVTLSTVKAWPGQEQVVGFDGTLGLFGINLTGFGNLLNLGRRKFVFDGATWQQG